MSSPLCNPRFLEHLKKSKARTKLRMNLKVDRMIDRVYSEVLADLHKFFTFDDGLVRSREVHFDGEPAVLSPCTIMQLHNQSSNITPPDITTVPNVSQNGDYQFDTFQTLIPQSVISTVNKPPNIAKPINSCRFQFEPPQPITQHDMNNPTPRADFEEPKVKDEFDETIVELCDTRPNSHFSQSFALVCQTNQNICDDEDDEEECDCDDCVNGGLEGIRWNEVDDGDSVDWFEDNIELEESHQPVKKPKLDTTQPKNTQTELIQKSSRQLTQPNQVNNQDKQFITVHLKCPQATCPDTFSEDQLHQHMWEKHFIRLHRCLVKDCAQSFDKMNILSDHIKLIHKNTIQWHWDKCHKYFATYQQLSVHNYQYHQFGHFQCSFPACTFTGDYRMKMFNHYAKQHKQKLSCEHSGCNYQTPYPIHLMTHQRTHSGIKPYRCKWPQCDYAAAQKCLTQNHIRRNHFGAQLGDLEDYVEVVQELLLG